MGLSHYSACLVGRSDGNQIKYASKKCSLLIKTIHPSFSSIRFLYLYRKVRDRDVQPYKRMVLHVG